MKSKLIIFGVIGLVFCASQVFAHGGEDHDESKESMMEEKGSMMKHKGSMMEHSDGLSAGVHIATEEELGSLPNVGNKICPVSGEKVGGDMGDPVKVEYKGKVYNLCCTMCAKDFKKDPEKYIKIIKVSK